MHPEFLEIGGMTLHWYGVCMAVAFLVGLANWNWHAKREGLPPSFCSDMLFNIMVAGILGGRLAYVLGDLRYYIGRPHEIFFLWEGGLIFYGGFIGALAALAWFARRRRIRFLALMDFGITSLPLSHAIGRIGCFMNGCCFGEASHLPFAVRYPAESLPWWRQIRTFQIDYAATRSLPVHPVQLYEVVLNLLVFVLLLVVFRRVRVNGVTSGVYLLAYPVGRFITEFWRGTDRALLGGVPSAQVASLVLLTAGVALLLFAWRQRQPRELKIDETHAPT